jgi:ABC-type lipoprotein release transport system permease subunit
MINTVELFVGLRYLRAKRRTRFVSFITLISLIGIALGVWAMGFLVMTALFKIAVSVKEETRA